MQMVTEREQEKLYLYQTKTDFKQITIIREKGSLHNDKSASSPGRYNNYTYIYTPSLGVPTT